MPKTTPRILSLKTWQQALYQHYTAPLATSFKQFKLGAIFFSVGLIIIYLANQTLTDSLKQEVIVLLGLIIGLIGFFIALMAHIRMLISRVIIFLNKKDNSKKIK